MTMTATQIEWLRESIAEMRDDLNAVIDRQCDCFRCMREREDLENMLKEARGQLDRATA